MTSASFFFQLAFAQHTRIFWWWNDLPFHREVVVDPSGEFLYTISDVAFMRFANTPEG